MDKSWMHSDRRSKAYEFGVEAFLNFSVENLLTTTHIRCPCVKCVNLKMFGVGIIRDHLYFNGVDQSYKNWTFHGEPWEAATNASRNVEEDDGHSRYSFVSEEIDMDDHDFGDFGSDPYEFANVIGDGDQPVYPGCRKKEYEDSTNCPSCGISRWKEGKDSILKEGVPAKVVWYFPPIPSRYSCWPVILVTYNLPPWMCMKRKFMMLTLLISGPKQPGNDIDVYLEPLIDDLKSLWDGIRGVYDAHNGEYFTLRAALMWTINDFPAYGNLSGCVVKGYKACPICGDDTPSHSQRAAFNGKPKYGTPPEPLTGEEVLHMVEDGDRVCWKKKSIFFDLEYWKYLPVRHALDVMHIEKNVCDSIIDSRLLGLKSHNCHTLMQQLLPVAIRSVLEKPARQHMIHIKTAYPKFRKRTKWLQDKHNSTFIQWLRLKVQSELNEEDNHGVSENLRWLAAGPNMSVPLYRSYLIKGDVIIECEPFTRGMPNVDTFDELVGFGHKTISAKNTGSRLQTRRS
ncbi:unnamed protein product [Prunus brigantina]